MVFLIHTEMFCVCLPVTATLNIWIYCFHSSFLFVFFCLYFLPSLRYPSCFPSVYVNSFPWTSAFLLTWSLFFLICVFCFFVICLRHFPSLILLYLFFLLSSLPSIFLLPSFLTLFPLSYFICSFFLFFCFPCSQQILIRGMSKYSCREDVGEIGVYLHVFSYSTKDGGKCSALSPVFQWRTQEFCSVGFQQIQLRTEDRENGDLGAVAP